jgi:hypothetical protein
MIGQGKSVCKESGSMILGEGGSNLQILCVEKTFITKLEVLRELCITHRSIYFKLVTTHHISQSTVQTRDNTECVLRFLCW